jgi:hypothetical protein
MQRLINLFLYEMRHNEYQQEMARINAHGWKSVRGWTAPERVAKPLIALAEPKPGARTLAQ